MTLDTHDETGFRPIFDGSTLSGWHAEPRVYGSLYPGGPHLTDYIEEHGMKIPEHPELHAARWFVEDGILIGEQSTPGYGGYLVSDATFGDFELVLEARPDWPADTGVMLRRKTDDWAGFQVLIDHRESGGIGGFFGNGLASFSALPFAVVSRRDENGTIVGLAADDPPTSVEPVTPEKIARLSYAADVNDFLDAWKFGEWNEIRIRCVGALPVITTWVNGVKIAELDTATLDSPDYDPDAVLAHLGTRGHLALEVHDNDEMFGDARWAPGAQCRWRNIRVRDIESQEQSA
ncbi:3-keto-disaccharide hydrolase [Microbacterium saperdae]|uniref:Uncharacterized protein DUF1080 n=1 Tax=Microbacterium saperdae TaxID=69368 RepID=A0A543BL50_9MICO|nr:DUF1080 domain-containing protein [Microbacterium saperdae]TQL85552.1 uncharacterized protein DUF1080 [Microbacterium saperdae]GGM62855.1 hypothetical protein GCM10010489_37910 [Microbacterium saperdae]